MFTEEEVVLPKSINEKELICPLRDFRIVQNSDDIKIIEGEEIEVPVRYIENLKTEKVI